MKDNLLGIVLQNVDVDERKKEQSLNEIQMAARKKKIVAVPSFLHKIKVQFDYMEKIYLFFPLIMIFCVLGIVKILNWNQMQQEVCSLISSVIAFLAVFGAISISRVFAYHMGEVEASCYLNLGEIIAIRMLLSGMVYALIIILCSILISGWIQHGFITILLYMLTPFIISNCICLLILLHMKEKNMMFCFFVVGIFCACIWMYILSNSWVYESGMIVVWSVIFIISVVLFCSEIRLMFWRIKKGEMICCQWN